jgi:hypothetical protein
MDELRAEFDQAVRDLYATWVADVGQFSGFQQAVRDNDGDHAATAIALVRRSDATYGFGRLVDPEVNRPELTLEQLVQEDRWTLVVGRDVQVIARQRLRENVPGWTKSGGTAARRPPRAA